MMEDKNVTTKNVTCIILYLILALVIIFDIIYIFRGANLLFSADSASVNLLAKEQRITGKLFPYTWNYATDLSVWTPSIIIAVLQYFMTNELLMRSISVFAFVLLALFSVYKCCKILYIKEFGLLACVLVFLCQSEIMRDMYLAQAAYIRTIVDVFLLYYLFINSIDEGFNITNKKYLVLFIIYLTSIALFSLQPFQQVIIPLLGSLIVFFIYKNWHSSIKNLCNNEYNEFYKLLLIILVISISLFVLYMGVIKKIYPVPTHAEKMLVLKNRNDLSSNFSIVVTGILYAFGFESEGSIISIDGIRSLINLANLCMCIICPILLIRKYRLEDYRIKLFIGYATIHIIEILIILIFGSGVVDYIAASRYVLSSVLLLEIMSIYYILKYVIKYNEKYSFNKFVLLVTVFVFSFLNTSPKVKASFIDYNKNFNNKFGVIKYLEEQNLHYGYATFWNAGIYTVASDFKVEISPINIDDRLTPYYWLVSDRNYIPENYEGRSFLMLTKNEYNAIKNSDGYCYSYLGIPSSILSFNDFMIQTYEYNISINEFGGKSMSKLDFAHDLVPNTMSGFYHNEGSFAWIEDEASIKLSGEDITKSGIKITIDVQLENLLAQNISDEPRTTVFINGNKVGDYKLISGEQTWMIPSKHFMKSSDDNFLIEFKTNCYFIPEDIGVNQDNRELSIMIKSILPIEEKNE